MSFILASVVWALRGLFDVYSRSCLLVASNPSFYNDKLLNTLFSVFSLLHQQKALKKGMFLVLGFLIV